MARPRPSLLGVRRAGAVAALSLSCLAGCDGTLINLGNSAQPVGGGDAGAAGSAAAGSSGAQGGGVAEWSPIDEPVLLEEGYALANPTFPASGQYMVFTKQKRGEDVTQVWRALQVGGVFQQEAALPLGDGNPYGATGSALSASGEELWFGMFEDGELTNVFVSEREGDAWGPPQAVPELNSAEDDSPRPPGLRGTVMPLSSRRHDGEFYQIYFAERDAAGATWRAPNQDYLASINVAGRHSLDGFLSDDGLTLYFAATGDGLEAADLHRATRANVDEAFGAPEPLAGLQHEADERDPWLSDDGWLYYTSNRAGFYAIYRARRQAP